MSEFEEKLSELWKKIGSHDVMVLSTCAENRVSSRPMSVIVIAGKFYCQTDENYLKFKQISQNPNVSLSVKNFSIEGLCRVLGKPIDESNSVFLEMYKKHCLSAYEKYSHLESERLLEITPTLIYSWDYEMQNPYMEYWDFNNSVYRKEYK